ASLRSGAAAPSARTAPSLHDALPIFVSNGGGLAVLATDTLVARGVRLAELASETIAKLDAVLPPTWSRANPVDLIGDAPGARFEDRKSTRLYSSHVKISYAVFCLKTK